jgi:Kef-type K+ transport system membrane component KefB
MSRTTTTSAPTQTGDSLGPVRCVYMADVIDFFLKLLVILVSAKVFAELFAYLRLPSVLGELAAGIIIGPSVLTLIQVEPVLYLLAEIGILLLLFEVGLETDVGQLVRVGGESSLVAVTGVVLPAVLGFWISFSYMSLSVSTSLFVGGTLVATSIGITVRVLSDLKLRHTRLARVVLGAAVLDDIIGIVILAVFSGFAQRGTVLWLSSLKALGLIVLFLVAAPVIAKLLVPALSKMVDKSRTAGLLPTATICFILALAIVANSIGAPAIIGSFAAGIALARKFFLPFGRPRDLGLSEKVETAMKPVIELFVPVFFVMVGVSVNLREIDFTSPTFWGLAGVLTLAAIITKAASGIWARGPFRAKVLTGISMVPRGEVGLIFAEVGRRSGVFDDEVYAVLVFVVALTTLAAPLMLRVLVRGER